MAEVEIRRDGPVLWITLNRPDQLNALTAPMHAGLAVALEEARDPAVRAVVLTGAGRGFCAGEDVSAVRAAQYTITDELREHHNRNVLALRALEKPVLASVNGPAAGAGLALALACDVRIASDAAVFVPGFVGLGLAPDSGSTWLAGKQLGAGRAFEWLTTGRRLTAQEALQWGLVSEVLPQEELHERAAEVAELFAAMPTRAVWQTKRLLDLAQSQPLEQQLEQEARAQAELAKTPDFTEGVAAFLEKREPAFTGAAAERLHPIELRNFDDRRRWRLTVLVRLVLWIPHYFLVYYWTLLAVVVALVTWAITLVRRRPPRALHAWLARYVRYVTHAFAYLFVMAEPYPPFRGWSDTYPVDIAPEEPPAAQSRLTVGFRIFLALPALLLASVLFLTVLPIVAIIGWFAALAVARMPKGLQGLGAYCIRYTAQTAAYVLLITDRYPSLASGSPYQFEEAHDVGSPGRQS